MRPSLPLTSQIALLPGTIVYVTRHQLAALPEPATESLAAAAGSLALCRLPLDPSCCLGRLAALAFCTAPGAAAGTLSEL